MNNIKDKKNNLREINVNNYLELFRKVLGNTIKVELKQQMREISEEDNSMRPKF